jgi:hypothetical protein
MCFDWTIMPSAIRRRDFLLLFFLFFLLLLALDILRQFG